MKVNLNFDLTSEVDEELFKMCLQSEQMSLLIGDISCALREITKYNHFLGKNIKEGDDILEFMEKFRGWFCDKLCEYEVSE